MLARHVGGVHRGLLRGERSAFARSAEAERTRALPRDGPALAIGNGDDGVVEGGLNVHDAMRHVLLLLLLKRLLLAFFLRSRCCSGCGRYRFCHKVSFQFRDSSFECAHEDVRAYINPYVLAAVFFLLATV